MSQNKKPATPTTAGRSRRARTSSEPILIVTENGPEVNPTWEEFVIQVMERTDSTLPDLNHRICAALSPNPPHVSNLAIKIYHATSAMMDLERFLESWGEDL